MKYEALYLFIGSAVIAFVSSTPLLARQAGKHLPQTLPALAINCPVGQAETYLDVNNVRAKIHNTGGLFWDGGWANYEVPKGSGISALFTASLWVGGMVDGELRAVSSAYGNREFWPGPLDEQGLPPPDCGKAFDRFYEIGYVDLKQYEETGFISPRLRHWPWHLGAPVTDGDGNPNNYNLEGGDRPALRGHQMVWWVMHDRGGEHVHSQTPALGLEVHGAAFAAASGIPALHHTTFYHYKLIYRGDAPLEEAYVGLFVDPDLGNFDDDFTGADTTLNMAIVYNSDNDDEGRGGYGEAPPAVGIDLVQGPLASRDGRDNDRDGIIDEEGERLGMTSFVLNNEVEEGRGSDVMYDHLRGRWYGGHPIIDGCIDPYDNVCDASSSGDTTGIMVPGDPVTRQFWSEMNWWQGEPNGAYDRKMLLSAGPFSMQPGEEQDVAFAIVWAQGADHLDSITELRRADRGVQAVWDSDYDYPYPYSGSPPTESTEPLSPAPQALHQPTNATFHWQPIDDVEGYVTEFSLSPSFPFDDERDPHNASTLSLPVETPFVTVDHLQPDTTYYWRVLGYNQFGYGPWSTIRWFTTSEDPVDPEPHGFIDMAVTANGSGPLPTPTGAGASWAGFPSRLPGKNQQFGAGTWVIHAYAYPNTRPATNYAYFLSRITRKWNKVSPYDYEIRFTKQESYAYDMNHDEIIPVPFELWNTGINTPDDRSDDIRMIPYIDPLNHGNRGWRLRPLDHVVSENLDDPQTDRIVWGFPSETATGAKGYQHWEETALNLPRNGRGAPHSPDGSFYQRFIDDFIMEEMVLVNVDGGKVPGPYNQDVPEAGTVFRLTSIKPDVPVLAAPVANGLAASTTPELWWHGQASHIQLATDVHFKNLVFNEDVASEFDPLTPFTAPFRSSKLERGRSYYWRVGNVMGWSEAGRFRVATTEELRASITENLAALEANYPNPFRHQTTIPFTLPGQSHVRLTVYDLLGRRIATLLDETLPAGWHRSSWDASTFPSGIYFCRLESGQSQIMQKMVVLR